MSFQSVAVTPAQPNQAFYDVSKLFLFNTFDKASYKAAMGQDAPKFDTSRRPKTWFDSSVNVGDPFGVVIYSIYRRDSATGNWSYQLTGMTNQEAATVNFVPDETLSSPPKPQWEVPARALLANEVLYPSPFGLQIKRTDLSIQVADDLGQFTQADRDLLNRVVAKLGA